MNTFIEILNTRILTIIPSLICKLVDSNRVESRHIITDAMSMPNLTFENLNLKTLDTADENISGGIATISIVIRTEIAKATTIFPSANNNILDQYLVKLNLSTWYKKKLIIYPNPNIIGTCVQ